jgi:hypothetical protein
MRNLSMLVASIILLSACATPPAPTATLSRISTPPATLSAAPVTSYHTPSQQEIVDALINIIEASDPASRVYDPKSLAYQDFSLALPELAKLNSETNSAASELAYAIGFPRPDSILAAKALISLGPRWVGTTLPLLLDNLKNPRPEVRLFSLIAINTIGPDGSCALEQVGRLLWDSDPDVRTAAALAVQSLSGHVLVADAYVIDPDRLSPTPVAPDTPEGHIVENARSWWTNEGAKVNWHPSYDWCDP